MVSITLCLLLFDIFVSVGGYKSDSFWNSQKYSRKVTDHGKCKTFTKIIDLCFLLIFFCLQLPIRHEKYYFYHRCQVHDISTTNAVGRFMLCGGHIHIIRELHNYFFKTGCFYDL